MAIGNPDGTDDDSDAVVVTLHVGRAESTGDVDDIDGADSETLATWVYVNGELAGSQVLTITRGSQTQR